MLAAGLGLAALIAASATALTVIKWLGVAYLVYIGLRMIRRAGRRLDLGAAPRVSRRALWLQGFLTSASNPKAVVFFAALFPQFIDPNVAFWPQFAILSRQLHRDRRDVSQRLRQRRRAGLPRG